VARIKVPPHVGFPHNLGIEERASLLCYGQLVTVDPSAASYETVAVSRKKSYSTVKNQLDSARRKMGTNTTWGAYLLMMAREKVQAQDLERGTWTTSKKPGGRSSKPAKTGKKETRPRSVREQAAS
jgi:hypothetical protein